MQVIVFKLAQNVTAPILKEEITKRKLISKHGRPRGELVTKDLVMIYRL